MSKIVIDTEYQGYTVTGWAQGLMEGDLGDRKPYYQLFVVTPCSSWKSETYDASGLKAEKKRCIGPVWEDSGCKVGDTVKLFFDDKQRVTLVALDAPSSEDMSSEDMSSEDTSSEDTSSEDTSSEDRSSKDRSSKDRSSKDRSSKDRSSKDLSLKDLPF